MGKNALSSLSPLRHLKVVQNSFFTLETRKFTECTKEGWNVIKLKCCRSFTFSNCKDSAWNKQIISRQSAVRLSWSVINKQSKAFVFYEYCLPSVWKRERITKAMDIKDWSLYFPPFLFAPKHLRELKKSWQINN